MKRNLAYTILSIVGILGIVVAALLLYFGIDGGF